MSRPWACSENHPHPCNAADWTGPKCPVLPCGSGVAAAHHCCVRTNGDVWREMSEPVAAAAPPRPETVKRADLFGHVHDTYQTESELNGWRGKQGALL